MRIILLLLIFISSAANASAELKPSQARSLIAHVAGTDLPSRAVRVTRVSGIDANTAAALAEIETTFRLEQNEQGRWSVQEVRVGQDRWESVAIIAAALGATINSNDCHHPDLFRRKSDTSGPTVKRARCLLASLFGIQLPSDAVRIKDVSALGVPLVSRPSALVTAKIWIEFRFSNTENGRWRIDAVRSGNRDWVDFNGFQDRIDNDKKESALIQMKVLAGALERFRAERGFYVTSDQQSTLLNHLTPAYLSQIIRLDPWHRPYQYQGERDRFTLRSDGPDRKQNTPDDIVLSQGAR